jgi:hypothetical protein
MSTWCEWNPIIVGVGAAIIGAAMMWVWQRGRQLTLTRSLNEQITARTALQQALDNTQILSQKHQTTATISPTLPINNSSFWEEKYRDILQQYQLQEQKGAQYQQELNETTGINNITQNTSEWEIHYKQLVPQYINARERIRGLEILLKQYSSENATSELPSMENTKSPQAAPSYWKKAHDDLQEKHEHLIKQFQRSHLEINVLADDKETLEKAYIRAKEDSEYRELYEALLLQQRAYEQAIMELEEEIIKFKDRGI